MRVGFVVLNYMNYAATVSCANSLVALLASNPTPAAHVWRLLILDNDSPNQSWTALKGWLAGMDSGPRGNLALIKNNANLGYGAGNNIGLRILFEEHKCDIVFVVNSDVIPERLDLDSLESIAGEDTPMCIGVMMREESKRTYLFPGGAYFSAPSFRSYRPAAARSGARGIFYVSGAFIGFNRALYTATEGFTDTTFLYFEELDLFYRAREVLGHWPKVKVLEGWQAIHSVGGSTGNATSGNLKSRLSEYYSARARILFARRHLRWLIANAICYNLTLCIDRGVRGRWQQLLGIVRGTAHGLLGRSGQNKSH